MTATAEAAIMGKKQKLSASAKAGHAGNKKPVTLAQWDFGAKGQANQIGLVVEDAAEITPAGKAANPNGVKRARRVDMLELWHRRGEITTAGYNAAEKLRDAFEATERAPGWPDNDRVQSSPKPDHAVTIQIDRLSKYHAIARHIHRDDRELISHCVLSRGTPCGLMRYRRKPVEGKAALRDALERLAANMQGR
jgi:hypothetical protein